MKAATIVLGAFAVLAAAQDLGSLPDCARTCANNMRSASKAEELDCDDGDLGCLCVNPNFTYGFRDWAAAVCTDSKDANSAVEYAVALCSNNGVVVTAGPSNQDVSATATGTASTILTTITSGDKTITSAVDTTVVPISGGDNTSSGVSVSTSVVASVTTVTTSVASTTPESSDASKSTRVIGIVTTITSDGSEIVSTLSSTIASEGTRVVGIVTTISSDGSAIVSTLTTVASGPLATASSGFESLTSRIGSATETSDSTATGTDSAATTTSDNAGAMATALPGVLAAAGLVALLL